MFDNSVAVRHACYLTTWVGDYHAPRLLALQEALREKGGRLTVVQFGEKSSFYSHQQTRRDQLISALDFRKFPRPGKMGLFCKVLGFLYSLSPSHVFVLGYGDPISLAAIAYAQIKGARVYFMSDSKADDQPRSTLSEKIKSFMISYFHGALVAGARHRDYFRSLGFSPPIETPYDVVDNAYFAERAAWYSRKIGLMTRCGILPARYVLCVSRLVGRKRVPLALDLFAISGAAARDVTFLLIGDGPEKANVLSHVEALGLEASFLHVPQVANHRMPAYYAGAEAILLTSEYDQWGLCINEAMACGVPAFVTRRCGVAGEIVTEATGRVFEEDDIEAAGADLAHLLNDPLEKTRLSLGARNRMDTWGVAEFASAALRLMDDTNELRNGGIEN